jgi:hypothetical protein
VLSLNRSEKKLALNNEINQIVDELRDKASDFKVVGKNVLIIGGLLAAGYALTRILNQNERDAEETTPVRLPEPEESSVFVSALKGAATSILLAIAKQKLIEYLETLNDGETN